MLAVKFTYYMLSRKVRVHMRFPKNSRIITMIQSVIAVLAFLLAASSVNVFSEGGCGESLSCCEAEYCLEVFEWLCVTLPTEKISDCDYFICCSGGGEINDADLDNYLFLVDGVWI